MSWYLELSSDFHTTSLTKVSVIEGVTVKSLLEDGEYVVHLNTGKYAFKGKMTIGYNGCITIKAGSQFILNDEKETQ